MSTGTLRRHRVVVVIEPKKPIQDALEKSLPKLVKQPAAEDKKRSTKKTE